MGREASVKTADSGPSPPSLGQGNPASARAMRKSRFSPETTYAMEIERINAIGTLLTDLTARTDALRGYL
jgi:hypothetical protein